MNNRKNICPDGCICGRHNADRRVNLAPVEPYDLPVYTAPRDDWMPLPGNAGYRRSEHEGTWQ